MWRRNIASRHLSIPAPERRGQRLWSVTRLPGQTTCTAECCWQPAHRNSMPFLSLCYSASPSPYAISAWKDYFAANGCWTNCPGACPLRQSLGNFWRWSAASGGRSRTAASGRLRAAPSSKLLHWTQSSTSPLASAPSRRQNDWMNSSIYCSATNEQTELSVQPTDRPGPARLLSLQSSTITFLLPSAPSSPPHLRSALHHPSDSSSSCNSCTVRMCWSPSVAAADSLRIVTSDTQSPTQL